MNKKTTVKEDVNFGFSQITNPTPSWAKWVFRYTLYAAAFVNLMIPVITEMPQDTKDLILRISLYTVTAVHAISKLFGVEVEEVDLYTGKVV